MSHAARYPLHLAFAIAQPELPLDLPAPSCHAASAAIGNGPDRLIIEGCGNTRPGHTIQAGLALPSRPLRCCGCSPPPPQSRALPCSSKGWFCWFSILGARGTTSCCAAQAGGARS